MHNEQTSAPRCTTLLGTCCVPGTGTEAGEPTAGQELWPVALELSLGGEGGKQATEHRDKGDGGYATQ